MQVEGARIVRHECRFVLPDERIIWVSVSTSRVPETPERPAHLIMHIEDVSDRKRLEAELSHRALHDPLTGLANRTLLAERMRESLGRRGRHTRFGHLFYLDLDGFKAVNDRFGHAVGRRGAHPARGPDRRAAARRRRRGPARGRRVRGPLRRHRAPPGAPSPDGCGWRRRSRSSSTARRSRSRRPWGAARRTTRTPPRCSARPTGACTRESAGGPSAVTAAGGVVTAWICARCAVQYPDTPQPPPSCPICEDEREAVAPGGQRWTHMAELAATTAPTSAPRSRA